MENPSDLLRKHLQWVEELSPEWKELIYNLSRSLYKVVGFQGLDGIFWFFWGFFFGWLVDFIYFFLHMCITL